MSRKKIGYYLRMFDEFVKGRGKIERKFLNELIVEVQRNRSIDRLQALSVLQYCGELNDPHLDDNAYRNDYFQPA